ncbi:uncharacterized protein BJ171DRAFT_174625 [Polychytrium aggregatum]|uniref:uncharacterized protein n=1 Tax=Polychytrium aggregatum TaxID=110093 RepID=UPI0022FE8B26|nr:uncharacterized protein BJ171DRAFT_174625 [Polychytrium aggregatum]KAI9209052.1 hypothetical protein BJ171DRAFT_174625 [Polychytrium aggregatum]
MQPPPQGTSKSGDIFLSLVTLSMSFSLRKPADLDSIVHQADSKIMETISLSIAPGSSSTVRSLGFHLMRFCLTLRGAETLVSESESLVAILDEADEVSEAAIGLLADCASSHPEAVLPLICGRMDSGSVGKRRNALLVLEEIVSINKGVIQHHRRSGLRDMLCGQLLNRLGDDDIKLRNITTRLFRMLALQLLLPKLTPLLEHTDARIRAAAEASLVLVLSEGRPPTKNIEMFIEFMRNCYCGVADDQNMISPEIRSPNDIRPTGATQTPAKEVADKRLSYQLRVISKWAGALSPESWMETLPVILAKCYSSPGDTVLVRALSAMSAYWTDHNVIGAICRQILDIAVAQPRLTDELLNDPSPDSADQVRGLLFARLSPMLVFKVLSIPAIGSFALRSEAERNQATAECRAKTSMDSCAESIADYRPHQSDSCNEPHGQSRDEGNPDVSNHGDSVADADLCPRLVNEFITRIESTMEYEEVRRLAAELVARFPLELIGDLLVDKFEHSIGEQQWLMARSYVFALCNMIATHQDLSISTVRSTSPLQPQQSTRLVAAALRVMMSSENTADKNTMKSLEAGCLECLALLVSVCSTKRSQQAAVKADAARARIQEIDATDIAAGPATLSPLNDVVDAMLYLCHPLALVEASEPSQPSDEYAALSRSSYFKELYTSLRSICILPQDQRRSPSASGTIRYEVATHFCNAVATAVNHLSPPKSTGTAAQADSESSIRDAKHQGLLWLASRSYRRFLDVAHWASGQVGVFPELDIVGGSCFQTLFRFVYGLRSESDAWIPDTMDVCLVGLRSSGRLIHNHALKLMTACIGTSTKSLADPLRSLQTRKTLEDFVRTTNDPSSKELAQRVMANM